MKKNSDQLSQHYSSSWNFNYHGITKIFSEKEPNQFGKVYFTVKRIVVVQMKCEIKKEQSMQSFDNVL